MVHYKNFPTQYFVPSVQQEINSQPAGYQAIVKASQILGNQYHLTQKQFYLLQGGSIAGASVESGLNPSAVQQGGGGGLGLFQLSPGGEGSNLTNTQKMNPFINAYTAMTGILQQILGNPRATIGADVNNAQRPAVNYSSTINGLFNMPSHANKIAKNGITPLPNNPAGQDPFINLNTQTALTVPGTGAIVSQDPNILANPSGNRSGSSGGTNYTSWGVKIGVFFIVLVVLGLGLSKLGKSSGVTQVATDTAGGGGVGE